MKIQFAEIKGSKAAVFWDCNNSECSWQSDVIQGHELIWLGVNVAIDGRPGFRMLLDKSRALVLREIITQFIETGKAAITPDEMPEKTKPQKPVEAPQTSQESNIQTKGKPDEIQDDSNQNPQA